MKAILGFLYLLVWGAFTWMLILELRPDQATERGAALLLTLAIIGVLMAILFYREDREQIQ